MKNHQFIKIHCVVMQTSLGIKIKSKLNAQQSFWMQTWLGLLSKWDHRKLLTLKHSLAQYMQFENEKGWSLIIPLSWIMYLAFPAGNFKFIDTGRRFLQWLYNFDGKWYYTRSYCRHKSLFLVTWLCCLCEPIINSSFYAPPLPTYERLVGTTTPDEFLVPTPQKKELSPNSGHRSK